MGDAIQGFFLKYEIEEILMFLLIMAIVITKGNDIMEDLKRIGRRVFSKQVIEKTKEEKLEDRLGKIEEKQTDAADQMCGMKESLEILIESDKDSIKAYLTDKHHYYYYIQKWIDNYNLDCIERRYVHYKNAGGNSFVDHLVEELRKLPTQPPKD